MHPRRVLQRYAPLALATALAVAGTLAANVGLSPAELAVHEAGPPPAHEDSGGVSASALAFVSLMIAPGSR